MASIIGKIIRDGGSASHAAAALGLDPGDFQVAPALKAQQRGKGAQQQQQQPRIKPAYQQQLKDKGKDKGKGKNKGKNKGKPSRPLPPQSSRVVCFNWNRNPEGCSDPCPNDRDHTCEKCGGNHRACNCKAEAPRNEGK